MSNLTDRARAALRGRYEIEREVGRGGMATVFLARDPRHDRAVAVKVLHPELAAALGTERFLREVRITARLNHPHILPLLDSGENQGLLYYVMPFVEGESLRARLERDGALPVADALAVAREVADGLGYAHGHGIVHRDIKPENILLASGHALVADFGIARAVDEAVADRMTATGMAIGTPHYMSPEALDGRGQVDPRSDLYSLGCVVYEMLAGAPPFEGRTPQAIAARRLTEAAPSLRLTRDTVPPGVDAAVQRALARTPGDRFQTAQEMAAALRTGEATPAGFAGIARGSTSRWRSAAMAVVVVLVIGAVAWLGLRGKSPSTRDAGAVVTVAVMPFVNLSADSSYDYFADGLTDELISSLSLVEGLQVASRTSSFALRHQGLDIREVGRRLGVGAVLEGSVRRGEGRVRVSTRLVNVADGYQRWSQSYDRNVEDALVIQEQIAHAIVERLRGGLGGGQRSALSGGTTDAEAYDLYLRARFFRHKRTEEGLRRAIELLNQAVARAPDYARAHAGIAESYAVLGFYEYEPPALAFPAASRSATEALRLDPGLGSAHATLGYAALYYDWDWPRAEREFRQAIAQEPSYATAHQWYANHLTAMGRFGEAEQAMRQALVLDPLLLVANAALGWVWYHKGDYPAALRQLDATLELDQAFVLAHLWKGMSLEAIDRLEEAETSMRRASALSGDGVIFVAALARTLALRGKREEAERLLGGLRTVRVVPSYEIAKVHAALGNRPEAFRWLERAFTERSHSLVFLRVDPQLTSLRSDPAFERLARQVGLP